MKTILLITALPLLSSLATAQDSAPAPQKAETPAVEALKPKRPAWLGVQLTDKDGTVVLMKVQPGSPAAKAGLEDNDSVLAIGGQKLEGNPARVVEAVAAKKPGEAVELRIRRGNEDKTIRVELGERPGPALEFRGEFQRPLEEQKATPGDEEKKQRGKIEGVKERIAQSRENLRRELETRGKIVERLKKQMGKLEEQQKETPGFPPPEGEKLRPGPGPNPGLLLMMPDKAREQAIWKRVEETVGRALKESGLSPEVVEKAMSAVKEARRQGSEQEMRKAKLKAEAAKLEKEIEALRQKADRVREELKRSGD